MQLSQFHAKSAAQVEKALKDHSQAKALIFDLRGNGGGVLDGAVKIASFFFPQGTVVVRVKSRDRDEVIKTPEDGPWKNLKMAVLIDGYSASASEVLAGAFQDHERAEIWGEKSYGKALVQQVFKLEDGKSGLKLTIARYLTPNGHFIQRSVKKPHGIVPDKPFTFDPYDNDYYIMTLKESWKKLGIKQDVEAFLKENPPVRQDVGEVDPLMKKVHEELVKAIK